MTEEEKKTLKNMGALGYPFETVARIVGSPDQVKYVKTLENAKSPERIAYEDGVIEAQYKLDLKLFEMATSGDLRAMDKLELRKKQLKRKQSY